MKHFDGLDELLSFEDKSDSIVVLDSFIAKQCDYGEKLDELTEPQKSFFYNQALEREVNNGGFDQFFFNETGKYAHETTESLKLIGAYKTADILQRAINQFPEKIVPRDRLERVEAMKKIEDVASAVWEELDQEFYAYEENLNLLNLEYVRQNRSAF